VRHAVLIIGSDRFESLESSYARAFRKLNWDVQFWDPVRSLHWVARGYHIGRLFSTFVHVEPWLRKANLELLKFADKLRPDLILVIGTSGVRGATLAQIKVRLASCLIYCIYPDTPHNLDIERINCLPFFDRVMTSSPAWVNAFERFGAERVYYLPFAADPELHHPIAVSKSSSSLAHDVVFIGNWRYERELFLEQLADFDLCLWGEDYWKHRTRPSSPLRARWGGRPLTGAEAAKVCAESKILLNFMDSATWPGPNMRSFEQPACHAFVLVNRSPALVELFKEGETIECFDSVEEARDKITYYLAHDAARRRIADASYRFVIEGGHTYMDRARQLIDWAEGDGLR
jgi:spore maturation protein CgeB